jgi:hypothetical protein
MSSMLVLFVVPSVFLISNLMVPPTFTVNVAVCSVVAEVVIVEPVWVHVDPLFTEYHNCHVVEASDPYLACLIVTVEAPFVTLNFIVILPELRTLAEAVPFLISLELVPIRASSIFQTPVPKVTSAAAYAVFDPVSKPSVAIDCVAIGMMVFERV